MATTLTYQQRLAAGAAAKAAATKEQQAALATTKPSPTSVTGLPKTNANSSVSGSITPSTASDGSFISSTKAPVATTTPITPPAARTYPAANPVPTPAFVQGTGTESTTESSGFNTRATTTPLPSAAAGTNAGTTTTPPSGTTAATTTGTTPVDQGTADLTAATDEYVKGQNAIVSDLQSEKASDTALIQQDAAARMAELENAKDVLNTLHEQNLSQLDAATAASQVANDNALKKQEAAVKSAQDAVDQKYLELKAAQNLENKRAEIRQETSLGVLGGTFSTAGAADIEDTIVQGDQALNSLGLSNIATNKDYETQLTQFYDDYRQKNLDIQNYKMDKVNESYKNLQDSIAQIQEQEDTSEEDKETQILNVGKQYNNQITAINSDVVQAKYQLAQTVVARADQMKADATTAAKEQATSDNLERDDARTAIQNIIADYPADALANMTDAQKAQLQALEVKAGYPEGLVASGVESMKETLSDAKINQMNISNDQKQQLIDLKAKSSQNVKWFTDDQGNAVAAVYDPVSGAKQLIPYGQVGTSKDMYSPAYDPNSGALIGFNKNTGTAVPTASSGTGVQGAGVKGDVGDALDVPNGTVGGECGHFVNDYIGSRVMKDSLSDKEKQINSKVPAVGSAFIMDVGSANGHTGFVEQLGTNPQTGNPGILAKDSNWSKDGKVQSHWIDQGKIEGYMTTGNTQQPSQSSQSSTPPAPTNIIQALTQFLKGGASTSSAPAPEDMSTKDLADAMTVLNNQAGAPKATNFYSNMSRTQLITQYKAALAAAKTKQATADANLANKSTQSFADQLASVNI